MVYAIILFALTYVLMLAFSKWRPYIALGSALIFIVTGMLPVDQIFGAIDFNVLLMIAGTMGLVQLFIDSRMPALLADMIMEKVPNVQMAAVSLSLFAGIISAFFVNSWRYNSTLAMANIINLFVVNIRQITQHLGG